MCHTPWVMAGHGSTHSTHGSAPLNEGRLLKTGTRPASLRFHRHGNLTKQRGGGTDMGYYRGGGVRSSLSGGFTPCRHLRPSSG